MPIAKKLLKLQTSNLTDIVWITNLFSNRTFCSSVNEMLAAVVKLISGVIQGSVIGPLMFLIYQ